MTYKINEDYLGREDGSQDGDQGVTQDTKLKTKNIVPGNQGVYFFVLKKKNTCCAG
ncbi:MAG: hypothetical protein PHX70_11345 [Clostridium sp.]|nr:hypothetical protein [Clostridium sp.]